MIAYPPHERDTLPQWREGARCTNQSDRSAALVAEAFRLAGEDAGRMTAGTRATAGTAGPRSLEDIAAGDRGAVEAAIETLTDAWHPGVREDVLAAVALLQDVLLTVARRPPGDG